MLVLPISKSNFLIDKFNLFQPCFQATEKHFSVPSKRASSLIPQDSHSSFYQSATESRRFTTKPKIPSDQIHISLGIIMLSFSRILLVILNLAILFSSLAQINVAKSLAHDSHRKLCLQENAGAIAFNATFLLITSIIGIIGTSCKVKSLQAIYLWIMLILTVSSFVYVTFISVLMPRVSAERVWENSKDGYWLNEYQPALQKALINGKDWFTIRNCYVEFGLCNAWRNQSRTMNQPTNQGRNYVELGCCYPPARCQLVQTNVTVWQTPKSGVDPNDQECVHWTISDRVGDCYDCDSCKAGYLTKYQENWQQGTFMHVFRLVFLTVVSSLALYAFNDDHNARLEHYT